MDYAERVKSRRSAGLVRRKQLGDDGECSIFGAAVRVDERTRRSSQTRATDRVTQQTDDRRFELTRRVHLNRRAVGQERLRDLGEVLHVRPKHDRFAVERGFKDVVSACRHEASADVAT